VRRLIVTLSLMTFLSVPVLAGEDEFEALEHDIIKLALVKTKITIQQAIAAGSRDVGRASLLSAELVLDGGRPVFVLNFLAAGGAEVTVDAATGEVLNADVRAPDPAQALDDKHLRLAFGESGATLQKAMDAAKNEIKDGTIVAAEAGFLDGRFGFELTVVNGDQFKKLQLDLAGKPFKSEVQTAEGQAWIFEQDQAGQPPAGWKLVYTNPAEGKAAWRVTQDPKAMSGPNVLTLEAKSGGGTFNLAMAETTSYQDVDVRTRIRANSGHEDQGGGLIWRAKDENNYYVCRINPLESNFRVYKVVDGKRQQLQSADATLETGQWAVVRAKMVGHRIQCYLDGKKLLDVTDDSFKDAGRVGLWTKADASSSFDNIAVQPAKASKEDQNPAKPAESGKEKDDDGDE